MNYTLCGNIKKNQNIEPFSEIPELGFIITRHVNSEMTNKYWIESINNINLIYKNIPIVIIDDNSNYKFINTTNVNMSNCTVINSEFKGRGELLPYYYFYRYHWFNKAVIIHDSVFILKYVNFNLVKDVQFLWEFPNNSENEQKEKL